MRKTVLKGAAIAASLVLIACGGDGGGSGSGSSASASGCPPQQKGDGVMVSSRYNYEDLQEANTWRETMFPSRCAGSLAPLVPELPDGFAVRPNNVPFVMKDDQVFLIYQELPETPYNEEGFPNVPRDAEAIEFEIVRFNDEELKTVKDWMAANPDSYLTGSVEGKDVHLLGGFGTGRPGKGDRLATSLHAIFDSGLVVRVSHKDLFTQRGGLDLPPLVNTIMGDIIRRAEGEGY